VASQARRKIEKAAQERGYSVVRANYESPVELLMGDGLGGWSVLLKVDERFTWAGGNNVNEAVADILKLPSVKPTEGTDKVVAD
jgi:hypothetical protein